MSGVKFQPNPRVSNSHATQPTTTNDGMRPGTTSHRTSPRAGDSMHRATTSNAPMAPSQRHSKRFEFIQGMNESTKVGDMPPSPRAMLAHKVNQVFSQLDQLHDQHLIDHRKGTTQVYTLPEFFWNDFGSNLSESHKEHLLDLLQQKIQDPKYQNAIFELGTIMTTSPPEHMPRVQTEHLSIVADAFEMDAARMGQAHQESMSLDHESFVLGVSRERVALTATASLAASRADGDGPFNADLLQQAAADMRMLQENKVPLAMLMSFADEGLLREHMQEFIDAGTRTTAKEVLAKFCPGIDTSQNQDVDKLKALAKAHRGNPDGLLAAVHDYEHHFLPYTVTSKESAKQKPTLTTLSRQPDLRYVAASKKPNHRLFDLQQKGRDLFKPIRNQAIILGGGIAAPRLVSKFLPSEIDVPGYGQAKPTVLDPPPHPENFRHLPGNITPDMTQKDVTGQLRRAGHNAADQAVTFPSENTTLGTAVCRDIESERFSKMPARVLTSFDMFQLISAGIKLDSFKTHAPNAPIISQNDGSEVRTEVFFGTGRSTLHQQAYEQHDGSPTFRPVHGTPQQRHFPGDPSGMWSISDPLHRTGASDSSTEASTGDQTMDPATLRRKITTYEKNMEAIQAKIALLPGDANHPERQALEGELNANQSMLERAQVKLQSWET